MRHNTQYLHIEELKLPVVMEGVDRIRGEETVVRLHELSHVSSTQAIVNFLKRSKVILEFSFGNHTDINFRDDEVSYVLCQCSALLVSYPIVVAITSVKTGLLRIAQVATTEHYMHLSTGELEFCNYQDRDKTISRFLFVYSWRRIVQRSNVLPFFLASSHSCHGNSQPVYHRCTPHLTSG